MVPPEQGSVAILRGQPLSRLAGLRSHRPDASARRASGNKAGKPTLGSFPPAEAVVTSTARGSISSGLPGIGGIEDPPRSLFSVGIGAGLGARLPVASAPVEAREAGQVRR